MNLAPITVVITTFNDYKYLNTAISSVLNQYLIPKQIIIVDDGSKKNTSLEIIDNHRKNNPHIEFLFIKKENGGASSARNIGLKNANYDYITFLDADDQMLPNHLNDKYNVLINLGNDYFGVYGDAITTKKHIQTFNSFDGDAKISDINKFITGIPGGSCYYLFRKSHLNEVQGYDENLPNNEDLDLIARLIKAGGKCKGSTGVSLHITIRNNSLSRSKDAEFIFNNKLKFLLKAETNGYFSSSELNLRKKRAYLVLAKAIFRKKPLESLKYIKQAFEFSEPVGFRENVLHRISSFKLTNH